jgi:hypothetical protein
VFAETHCRQPAHQLYLSCCVHLLHGFGSVAEYQEPFPEPLVVLLPAGCRYEYLDPTVNKGWDIAGEKQTVPELLSCADAVWPAALSWTMSS